MAEFAITRLVRLSRARRTEFSFPSAVYPTWCALIPVRGRFTFAAPSTWRECTPGTLALCPPRTAFRRRMICPTEFFHAHFLATGPSPAEDGLVSMADWSRVENTFHHLNRALERPEHAADLDAGTHLLRDLFHCARWQVRSVAPSDRVMQEAARFIEVHAGEPLRMADVARRFRLPAPTFSRRFHAAHGMNPREFLIQRRLAHASTLLRDTDWTHDRIADVCGWPNAYYFSRQFRAFFGRPPSAWRREQQV